MKHYLFITLLLTVILTINSCQINCPKKAGRTIDEVTRKSKFYPASKTKADSDRNDSIAIAQVENLPEFKRLLKNYNNNTDTSSHLAVMIAEEPDSSFKYYWIKVGLDGPYMFQTLYHFYVDPNNLAVNYFDTVSDSVFTLAQWRRSGKDDLLH